MINFKNIQLLPRFCLVLVLLISASCSSEKRDDGARNQIDEPDILVTVLGSGTPVPSGTQTGAAILVEAAGKKLMFDCGRGCTTRLAQYNPKLVSQVDHLFVTHMHSDHLMGIDDLLLNGWVQGRKVPLRTWGPVGTNEMMLGIQETFKRDIELRRAKNVPAPSAGLDDAYKDLAPEGGLILDEDGVKVTAFLVDHASVTPAYGFKIEFNGRTVVISGDTTLTPSLYEQGLGADVLMLEVISPAMARYIETYFNEKQLATVLGLHLTTEQTAEIFNRAKPRLGVFYHTTIGGGSAKSLMDVTRSLYDGEVAVSHDLFQISVGDEISYRDISGSAQLGSDK